MPRPFAVRRVESRPAPVWAADQRGGPTSKPCSPDGALIVIVVGGASGAMRPRIARLVRTQVERLAAGEPAPNIVLGGCHPRPEEPE